MAIVVCPNCGAKNRVDEQAARTMQPVCGRCRTRLPVPSAAGQASAGQSRSTAGADGQPLIVTDATFPRDVLGAGPTPVLLDCWAPWCGPCRMLAPVLDQLAVESGGRYVIAKLNTDENPDVAGRYHIDAIPMMLLFKNGQLVDRIVGLQPKQAIERTLLAHVG